MSPRTLLIEARGLAIGYADHPVGRDIEVRIRPGEVLCLLGPNGSGKTTLFKTLLGLLPAQGGTIQIAGRELSRISRLDLARSVAYVPQAHSAQFPYTVLDMVTMGRTAHLGLFAAPGPRDRSVARDALARLGIESLADTEYTRISGGQRQLTLIARALAQEAPAIVMDEPTASLDFGNQVVVLKEVLRLARDGLGVILSTHDPDHAFAVADKVALLCDGGVVATGPAEAVLEPERLKSVYGVAVEIETLKSGQKICAPDFSAP